jgi:hypothetical protein
MTAAAAATATVAFDVGKDGRTTYAIVGPTAESVQDAIDTLTRTVDGAFGGRPGYAQFTGPVRSNDGWTARGTVVIFEGAPA